MKKQIGIVGLGKMGSGLALNFKDHGWEVVGFNRTQSVTDGLSKKGIIPTSSLKELVSKLEKPRVVWLMLEYGAPTQDMLFQNDEQIRDLLEEGDLVIEGSNAYYINDPENAKILDLEGIKYLDVGVSGGPDGARNGACLMIGGKREDFEMVEEVFKDISVKDGYKFFEGHGAGHYIKMIHNGIEYGMMQAIGEGFNLLKESEYKLNLKDVADIYTHGSVIESRLMSWTKEGLEKFGNDLTEVSGEVGANSEGIWTVETAKRMNQPTPIIAGAVEFRDQSHKNPSYIGKILTMLRHMFGKYDVSDKL